MSYTKYEVAICFGKQADVVIKKFCLTDFGRGCKVFILKGGSTLICPCKDSPSGDISVYTALEKKNYQNNERRKPCNDCPNINGKCFLPQREREQEGKRYDDSDKNASAAASLFPDGFPQNLCHSGYSLLIVGCFNCKFHDITTFL